MAGLPGPVSECPPLHPCSDTEDLTAAMSSNECFQCGRSDYEAQECPTGGGCGLGIRSHGRGGNLRRGFQFGSLSLPDTCYHCGESGYLADDCGLHEDTWL